ncbi:hypothetical protein ACFOWU_14165 [Epilithonimonas zeae]|uniref:Bacteriocin n=1 Tax=Epilithonimonas zeae TaxID=1416779 RepID=A0A1N6IQF9_9FLAO|nr:hypothetical protein [Epilithonimonas zeae]SIO34205.1 hypothetical protein SAMN05444409_2888 [Epilithonimonas zeae]
MKNLKKLSRAEMLTVNGGTWGWWACCSASACSTATYGNSTDLVCVTKGTSLRMVASPI